MMSSRLGIIPSYNSASSGGSQAAPSIPPAGASSSSSNEEADGRFLCNICLEAVNDPVTTLCGHLFCWPCLYRWLDTQHTTCPVCLAGVSRENGTSSSSSSFFFILLLSLLLLSVLLCLLRFNRVTYQCFPPIVIPLFIKGSESDPRTKGSSNSSSGEGEAGSIPSRPNAQRPEAASRLPSNNGMNNNNNQFGGLSFSAGESSVFCFYAFFFSIDLYSFLSFHARLWILSLPFRSSIPILCGPSAHSCRSTAHCDGARARSDITRTNCPRCHRCLLPISFLTNSKKTNATRKFLLFNLYNNLK